MPINLCPTATASLGEWAQWYAERGWPVFPCNGKAPLTSHGFHDATVDPFAIAAWWRMWPTANIGTPMGDGRWALDVDPRNGGDNTLFALERQHGTLPHTLLSHTGGGGEHYVWQEPAGGVVHQAFKSLAGFDGLDVIAKGGYIILPPSQHPHTGKRYLWDVVDGPDDMMPQAAPAWLETFVTQPPTHANIFLKDPHALIPKGERNNALAALAIRWRRAGMAFDEIRAGLGVANHTRCESPLPDSELDAIAYSKGGYAPNPQLVDIPVASSPASLNGQAAAALTPLTHPPQQWGTPLPTLTITDLADMFERTYPNPTWLIKNLIPEGLTFFVGSPKSSKTYLAYSLALSLAYEAQQGGQWLGQYPVLNTGPVVYISLEDDEADSRWRVAELAPWLTTIDRERFLFVHGFELPRLNEGLLEVLHEQVMERYHPSLVVLDPISYLYAPIKKSGDQFGEVRDMLLPLRWLGRTYHSTILGVDHRRKKSAEDVDIFETTYGSNAKLAIADAIMMIVRDDKEITINARIRKAEDQTLTLSFAFNPDGTAHWTWKGSTSGLLQTGQYSDLRMKVVTALTTTTTPMSIEDILMALNMPVSQHTRNSIKQILWRAQKAHEVDKTSRGQYVWSAGN